MTRFVRNPYNALILGSVGAALVAIAVFFFGAPPIILIPVGLITATIQLELQAWAYRRQGRR